MTKYTGYPLAVQASDACIALNHQILNTIKKTKSIAASKTVIHNSVMPRRFKAKRTSQSEMADMK